MAAACPIDWLPVELLEDILSRLSWQQQLDVRSVSCRWRAAADSCLTRRRELHVNGQGGVQDFETLLSLLPSMPAMRRACFKDVPLDRLTVERLCSSCPLLEQVTLEVNWDATVKEASVSLKTLLHRLPGLRLLDVLLPCPSVAFLRLLPEGLHTLALRVPRGMHPALFRHLERCPQLRELTLCGDLDDAKLKAALTSAPQLEVLAVVGGPSLTLDWTDVLEHCPQLWSVLIYVGPCFTDVESPDLLDACSRLERLSLEGIVLWASALYPSSFGQEPRLTHLDLHEAGIDDDALCRLVGLLPGLKHLKLDANDLTGAGLADGLRCLTSLQVLELNTVDTRAVDPVLDALSELDLKALSISVVLVEDNAVARQVKTVFRRCPKLTMLHHEEIQLDSLRALVDDLTSNPLQRGEVTLLVPRFVAREVVWLPRNVRVMEYKDEVWEKLTGWRRSRCCCCSDC